MDRPLVLALCGLLLIESAQADLQLTPRLEEYDLDGATLQRLVFFDGSRRVTYTPPPAWDYSGNSDLFILHPPRGKRGEAAIMRITLPRAESFDNDTIKRLTNEVLNSVPKNATDVAIVSQELNPLMIERKETLLVVIKYDTSTASYLRSVMFLNRGSEQLRFQLTAPKSEFVDLQKAFQGSHYSWQNL